MATLSFAAIASYAIFKHRFQTKYWSNQCETNSRTTTKYPAFNQGPIWFYFFRAFKDREMLVNHMRCHIEEKPYECLQCGKKFFKPGQLKEHKRRHFESGNFACTHCGKKFFTSTKLQVSSSIISLLLILLYIVSYQIASFSSKWELPALLSPSFITRGREGAKALILMKHSQFDRTPL